MVNSFSPGTQKLQKTLTCIASQLSNQPHICETGYPLLSTLLAIQMLGHSLRKKKKKNRCAPVQTYRTNT